MNTAAARVRSTTADIDVAVQYSRGTEEAPSTVRLRAQLIIPKLAVALALIRTRAQVCTTNMSTTSRGAYLAWLSQYPDEREFLFSPLSAISVRQFTQSTRVAESEATSACV